MMRKKQTQKINFHEANSEKERKSSCPKNFEIISLIPLPINFIIYSTSIHLVSALVPSRLSIDIFSDCSTNFNSHIICTANPTLSCELTPMSVSSEKRENEWMWAAMVINQSHHQQANKITSEISTKQESVHAINTAE